MEPVSRASWKVKAEPTLRLPLGFAPSFTAEEMKRIHSGLVPDAMEDKWFVFSEGEWTYFCRSWTGAFIYGFRAVESRIVESWVNRNPSEYTNTDVEYDRALLQFLIDALLLQKPAVFPVRNNIKEPAPGVYQHSVVGRAYPEATYQRSANGLWSRLRRMLGLRTGA